ncbi:MAG: endopeptidase La [Muribaculaceae bacterium]|nr:endopeptidase La [Muribaculaceae bacterium]
MSNETKLKYPCLPAEGTSIYWTPGSETQAVILDNVRNTTLIPLEDEVFFPYLRVTARFTNPETIESIKKNRGKKPICFFLPDETFPAAYALVKNEHITDYFGTLGYIVRKQDMPDGSLMVEIDMSHQVQVLELKNSATGLKGTVGVVMPQLINPTAEDFAQEEKLEKLYDSLKMFLSESDRNDLTKYMHDMPLRSMKRLSFMMQNSPVPTDSRYSLLSETSLSERRDYFIALLENERQNLMVKSEIGQKTAAEMANRQREEFLRTQMQQIKRELGDAEDAEIDELCARSLTKEWSETTKARFEKELRKLERFNPNTPDYAVQYTYLDTFLGLPWLHMDDTDFTLDKVEEVLDRDHFGLEKVKERIIEQMAVMKLRGDTKSPILCLYGPPGVGKTSLGKSIAEALGRKYVRVALGGLHDEAEIRGHRRTYLGSMPGRIIHALEQAGTGNPVMVLDEIDKIGKDYKGDPEQALLEVLDPEQNCKFHDNYIDEDYDLSKVLFIATANSLQNLSAPLLDRMELIEIGGYIEAEKLEIAKRHLIPRDLKELGFAENEVSFTDAALLEIISLYTRESGVRRLEKKICEVLRKLARLKASGKDFLHTVDAADIPQLLGKPEAFNDQYEGNDTPGVVTGLAWTQNGGEILFIESSLSPGKDGKLMLTGNLGDVMKESAMLALQYIKSNHERLGIPEKSLEFGTVHVHVPEGAVPKDGPSAGITILTSLASTFTGRKVRNGIAMTGEMTLRGRVLPVGGIKEKILAAKRAGISTILLCEKNRKDIEEIKPEYLEGLEFKYVETAEEVLDYALL